MEESSRQRTTSKGAKEALSDMGLGEKIKLTATSREFHAAILPVGQLWGIRVISTAGYSTDLSSF